MIEDLKQLRESEDHIEFKEAKRNYPFAGGKHVDPKERRRCVLGYIVALANEKGGRLVLGMADKMPHTVVGSDFAQDKVGELTDEIYERLGIRIEATGSAGFVITPASHLCVVPYAFVTANPQSSVL